VPHPGVHRRPVDWRLSRGDLGGRLWFGPGFGHHWGLSPGFGCYDSWYASPFFGGFPGGWYGPSGYSLFQSDTVVFSPTIVDIPVGHFRREPVVRLDGPPNPGPIEAGDGARDLAFPTIVRPNGVSDVDERRVERLLAPSRRPSLTELARAARLLAAGDRDLRAGHFGNAVLRYQDVLAIDRTRDEARFRLATALIADGQYGSAAAILRTALRERPDWPLGPHDVDALFGAAALGQVLHALRVAAQRPDPSPDVLFDLAYMLYFAGRRDAAAELFRNPPLAGAGEHVQVFVEALARARP
jgi:hypothetical protein